MIDVLLVLIIIFMIITPTMPKVLPAALPQQAADDQTVQAGLDIVISVGGNQELHLNQEPIEFPMLEKTLASLYRAGSANHIFVRGDRQLEFHEIVRVIDMIRGAGWDSVGLMTNE